MVATASGARGWKQDLTVLQLSFSFQEPSSPDGLKYKPCCVGFLLLPCKYSCEYKIEERIWHPMRGWDYFIAGYEDCLVEYQGKLRDQSDFCFLPFLVFANLALARVRLNFIWERNKLAFGYCGVEVSQPSSCCSLSHASEETFFRFIFFS